MPNKKILGFNKSKLFLHYKQLWIMNLANHQHISKCQNLITHFIVEIHCAISKLLPWINLNEMNKMRTKKMVLSLPTQ